MKKLRLKENATQYTVTRDRYGSFNLTNPIALLCLFRDISQLNRNVNYREEKNITGIFWFDGGATLKIGDVIKYNGILYRIENVTNAKTLLTYDTVNFIKCGVSVYRAIS